MKNPDAHVRLHWRGWWNGELAFHEDALIHPFLAGGRKRARVCCCRCWQALGIDGALACIRQHSISLSPTPAIATTPTANAVRSCPHETESPQTGHPPGNHKAGKCHLSLVPCPGVCLLLLLLLLNSVCGGMWAEDRNTIFTEV